MSSKIRKKKKVRPTGDADEPDEVRLAPHSFVICRGKVSKSLHQLMESMRKVMLPYTAASLKSTRRNSLKDFVAIAGPLHVSHLVMFSQTEKSPHMRIAKLPHGPTVYFSIKQFSTTNDVLNHVEGASLGEKLFHYQPLVAVNNFDYSQPHHVITSSMFQNMFPKLSISQLTLKRIRRCLLFHYVAEKNEIEFRQYRIRLLTPDLSRSVKKLVKGGSKLADLNKYQDIADYVMKSGFSSAGSDVELTQVIESANPTSGDDSTVPVAQGVSLEGDEVVLRNKKKKKSRPRLAVRLIEMGPRMRLELYKIEQGIAEGEVLYHSLFSKTPEEVDALVEKHSLSRKRPKHQFTEQNPNPNRPQAEDENQNEEQPDKRKSQRDGSESNRFLKRNKLS